MHADRYIFSKTSLLWSLHTPADLCSLLHWSLCNDSALTILVSTLLLISPYLFQSLHWEHIPDTSCVNPNIQEDHQNHSVLTMMPLISPYLFWSPLWELIPNTSCLKLKKPTESWGSVFSVRFDTENQSLSVLTMMPPFFPYSDVSILVLVSPLRTFIQFLLCKTQKASRTMRFHFHWHLLHQSKKPTSLSLSVSISFILPQIFPYHSIFVLIFSFENLCLTPPA